VETEMKEAGVAGAEAVESGSRGREAGIRERENKKRNETPCI